MNLRNTAIFQPRLFGYCYGVDYFQPFLSRELRMNQFRLVSNLLAAAALAACDGGTELENSFSPPVSISVERTPCFGDCPHYVVTLTSSGIVRFEPRGPITFIRILRDARGRDSAAFDTLPAVLRVETREKVKQVRHYHGCLDAPSGTCQARKPRRLDRRRSAMADTARSLAERWASPRYSLSAA